MHRSVCFSAAAAALLGMLSVFGLATLGPEQEAARTQPSSLEREVAALPPHEKSSVGRFGDPSSERNRAPPRGRPAEPQRA